MDDIYKDLEEYNPNLCKNCSQKSYSYLIIDATLHQKILHVSEESFIKNI